MTRLSVVIPCYNEGAGIPKLLVALDEARALVGAGYEWESVFVDDGSRDQTGALLEAACRQPPGARVIHHPRNRGLGAALRTGFAHATGDLIVTTDSDCTYNPREIGQMLKAIEEGADVVVASPYHPKGSVGNVPAYRLLLSRNLSRLYGWVTGANIYTYTSLFRVYRAGVLRSVQFRSDGFLSMAEILVEALFLGYRVVEHPTRLSVREYGQSKAAVVRLIGAHLGFLGRLVVRRCRLPSSVASSSEGREDGGHASGSTRDRGWTRANILARRRPIADLEDSVNKPISLPRDDNSTGRDLGDAELALLSQVIKSGTLTSTKGTMVTRLEEGFARLYGAAHCVAMSSGTASLHAALAAIDPEPGDEVVTTPITDMGAIAPIMYQGAIPVFADVDPGTYNVTADTIAPKITRRTRAILVTHLFGNPCDMDPILALARMHGLPIIEDCSQSYLAEYRGRLVGTLGDMGCFSLQQGKHMTCGEGGLLITNNPHFGRRVRLYVNKAWGYGDPNPDHYFLALNYRMTELQGAVALAQLQKLRSVVERRQRVAEQIGEGLRDLPGIGLPIVTPGATHVYWKYPVQVDETVLGVDVAGFAKRLAALGLIAQPRYIQKPAFMCEVLRERRTFGNSGFPFKGTQVGDDHVHYDPDDYPGTKKALARVLVVPINEFYTREHVEFIHAAFSEAVTAIAGHRR